MDEILRLLRSARQRLDQNAHLVALGNPREEVLIAISEIGEAIYKLQKAEAARK